MVKKKLAEELISDGANLLGELDRRNFPVEAMFWVHLPDQDYWRLVIASPLVAEEGGVAAYRRLGDLLRKIELAGITLEVLLYSMRSLKNSCPSLRWPARLAGLLPARHGLNSRTPGLPVDECGS